MTQWDDDPIFDESDATDQPQGTIRQIGVRFVALLLVLSLVGTFYVALRGIEDILVVIGLLLGVAYVASKLRKQREEEYPYRSDQVQEHELD